jgi:hypothetical protein
MMEPAIRYKFQKSVPAEKVEKDREEDRQVQLEWETKVGKLIFYLTCATSLWFFYWLNGIQCPC